MVNLQIMFNFFLYCMFWKKSDNIIPLQLRYIPKNNISIFEEKYLLKYTRNQNSMVQKHVNHNEIFR